jgi:hypothetical protein
MLTQMTASDFDLWRAYYATLPDRTEHYLAQICSLLANANFKHPEKKPFAPADFRPDLRTPKEKMMAELRFTEAQAAYDAMVAKARAAETASKYTNGEA